MGKQPKKEREDIYLPIPADLCLSQQKSDLNIKKSSTKQIVRQAIQGAYQKTLPRTPEKWDYNYGKKPKPLVTNEETELVIDLMQSLTPQDAIETALAAQFVMTHTEGVEEFIAGRVDRSLKLFEHGHKVLDVIQKYRNKGQQQINVQYNVNQGQVVNIKSMKDKGSEIDVTGEKTHES